MGETVFSRSLIEIQMLKFAICAGICFEWVNGEAVNSLHSLATASVRAWMAAMLAWIALEALQGIWRAVMLLDNQPPRRIDPVK